MRPDSPQSQCRWGELWTLPQRRALILVITVILLILLVRQWRRPAFLSDPPPPAAAHAGELRNRINPNIASLQRLCVLPGIGEKRAAAMIAYREAFGREHEGRVPFHRAEDLAQIKGFGPATVENLRPYLIFGDR